MAKINPTIIVVITFPKTKLIIIRLNKIKATSVSDRIMVIRDLFVIWLSTYSTSAKLIINKAPVSSFDSIPLLSIVPLEAFSSNSTIPKPKPVPPLSRLVVKNGVNIRFWFDSEIIVCLHILHIIVANAFNHLADFFSRSATLDDISTICPQLCVHQGSVGNEQCSGCSVFSVRNIWMLVRCTW